MDIRGEKMTLKRWRERGWAYRRVERAKNG
jgi:hypothetical protein